MRRLPFAHPCRVPAELLGEAARAGSARAQQHGCSQLAGAPRGYVRGWPLCLCSRRARHRGLYKPSPASRRWDRAVNTFVPTGPTNGSRTVLGLESLRALGIANSTRESLDQAQQKLSWGPLAVMMGREALYLTACRTGVQQPGYCDKPWP